MNATSGPSTRKKQLDGELVRSTPDAAVSMRVPRALVGFVEQSGVPRLQFLRAARLQSEQVEAPQALLALPRMYELCELALELTGDSALGLHWAESMSDNSFVPISHVIAHSASLRDALHSLTRFHRLLSEQQSFLFIEQTDSMSLRSVRMPGQSLRVRRFVAEMTTAGLYRLFRYFGIDAGPARVNFEYTAPAHRGEYDRVFAQAAHFEQPFTEVVFPRALLDARAQDHDNDVHDALRAIAERRLLGISQRTPYALRVRELLLRDGQPLRSDMKIIAHALGFSSRSLRRRLAEEATSFHDVVNEALAIIAKRLLRDEQRTIQETAYEMGFSDTSTFHRAFKRWTGITPSAYRNAAPQA